MCGTSILIFKNSRVGFLKRRKDMSKKRDLFVYFFQFRFELAHGRFFLAHVFSLI